MFSNKLALAVLSLAAMASAHALTGVAEFGALHSNITGPSAESNAQSASFLLDSGKNKFGAGVTNIHSWGESVVVMGLRAVTPVGPSLSLDSTASLSNHGSVAPRHTFGSVLSMALPRGSVGAGAERVQMRDSTGAWLYKAQGSYKVPSMPVTLNADATYTNDLFETGSANRVGLGATGDLGRYSVSVRRDAGRIPASWMQMSAADLATRSTRTGLSARTWVRPSWGVEAGLTHVDHQAYQSNEVRGSVFWKL